MDIWNNLASKITKSVILESLTNLLETTAGKQYKVHRPRSPTILWDENFQKDLIPQFNCINIHLWIYFKCLYASLSLCIYVWYDVNHVRNICQIQLNQLWVSAVVKYEKQWRGRIPEEISVGFKGQQKRKEILSIMNSWNSIGSSLLSDQFLRRTGILPDQIVRGIQSSGQQLHLFWTRHSAKHFKLTGGQVNPHSMILCTKLLSCLYKLSPFTFDKCIQ